jgi:hypothetical protein
MMFVPHRKHMPPRYSFTFYSLMMEKEYGTWSSRYILPRLMDEPGRYTVTSLSTTLFFKTYNKPHRKMNQKKWNVQGKVNTCDGVQPPCAAKWVFTCGQGRPSLHGQADTTRERLSTFCPSQSWKWLWKHCRKTADVMLPLCSTHYLINYLYYIYIYIYDGEGGGGFFRG